MIDPQREKAILEKITAIPIWDTLGFRIDEFDEGLCKASIPRKLDYDGIFESLHGGILMTLADSVACYAIMTRTGPGVPMATIDMNIRFIAPCLTGVTATARVIKLGSRVCPVAVDLHDTNGKLVAVAQVCYLILNRKPLHSQD